MSPVLTMENGFMKKWFNEFLRNTEGQDLIEYALLAATIGLGVVGAMTTLRNAISTEFGAIGTSIGS